MYLEEDEENHHNSVDGSMREDLEVDEKNLHNSVDKTMKEDPDGLISTVCSFHMLTF